MKIRALVTAAMMIVGVLGFSAPAQAWTADSTYSELSFPTYTDNNFNVVLSGRIQPAAPNRPVSLHANGAYAAQVTTDAYGRFSFTRNVTSPTTFKFFSAKQPVNANWYGPAGTGDYTVYPAPPVVHSSAFSSMQVPQYLDANDQVTLSGYLSPAYNGREVNIYKQEPDGSLDTFLGTVTTDANGWFSYKTPGLFNPKRFRLYSKRIPVASNTYYDNASYVTGVVFPPTIQASTYSELSFPSTAAYDGTVTLSGRIQNAAAGRQVNLYRDGVFLKSTTADAYGRFSFPGIVVTQRAAFKFFSAKQFANDGLYYGPQGTADYPVDPAPARTSSFTNLVTPKYTHWSGNGLVNLSGTVSQAGAGRVVSLFREDPATNSNIQVGSATTDANGGFVFTGVQVLSETSFHLYANPQSVNGVSYASKTSASFSIRSIKFQEDFNFTDTSFIGDERTGFKWTLRQQGYPTAGSRTRSRGAREAIRMTTDGGRTVAQLGIKPAPDDPSKFITGHISAPVTVARGVFEAKVRFHQFRGAQSAFWLMTPDEFTSDGTSHEFDIAERYNSESNRLKHNVYRWYPGDAGDCTDGTCGRQTLREATTDCAGTPNQGPDGNCSSAWWAAYHVVAGKWNMNGYWYQVDGGPWTELPTPWVGTKTPRLVLSLLINDNRIGELPPELTTAASANPDYGFVNGMSVDWVKVWQ